MAGESRRFKEQGYEKPKYMLPIYDRPLFDWVLLSFQCYFQKEFFLFVAINEEKVKKFLEDRIKKLGIKHFYCVYLPHPTNGQAETVYQGINRLNEAIPTFKSEPIIVFNIDTIRPYIQFPVSHGVNSWIEVFRATGDNWSFVMPNSFELNLVERCTEKIRISDLACTGLYSFVSFEQFFYAYNREIINRSASELYVAPIYNHLINAGYRITWHEVSTQSVLLSGVPKEYESLVNQVEKCGMPSFFKPALSRDSGSVG